MYPWSRVPAGAGWVAGGRHEHTLGARLKNAASYCYVFMEPHSFADPDSRAWGANSCVRWETEQGGKGGEDVGRGAGGRWHGVDCAPADPWLCAVGKSCACGGNGKSHVINDFLTAMYLPPLTVPQ